MASRLLGDITALPLCSTKLKVVIEGCACWYRGLCALLGVWNQLDEIFLLSNGDSFFDINYLALAQGLTPTASGVIALRRVSDTSRYGRVIVDGTRIVSFAEKDSGKCGEPDGYLAACMYSANLLLSVASHLPCSIETDVFPHLASSGLLESLSK